MDEVRQPASRLRPKTVMKPSLIATSRRSLVAWAMTRLGRLDGVERGRRPSRITTIHRLAASTGELGGHHHDSRTTLGQAAQQRMHLLFRADVDAPGRLDEQDAAPGAIIGKTSLRRLPPERLRTRVHALGVRIASRSMYPSTVRRSRAASITPTELPRPCARRDVDADHRATAGHRPATASSLMPCASVARRADGDLTPEDTDRNHHRSGPR